MKSKTGKLLKLPTVLAQVTQEVLKLRNTRKMDNSLLLRNYDIIGWNKILLITHVTPDQKLYVLSYGSRFDCGW